MVYPGAGEASYHPTFRPSTTGLGGITTIAVIHGEGPTARCAQTSAGPARVSTPAGGSSFSVDFCAFAPFGHELFGWWIGVSGDYADELPCLSFLPYPLGD